MSADTQNDSGSGFGAGNWARIIEGLGSGAMNFMQGSASNAASSQELKEAKRRTMANLLNKALRRDLSLYGMGRDYADELTDYKTQIMQQIARGFNNALQGSSIGGRNG